MRLNAIAAVDTRPLFDYRPILLIIGVLMAIFGTAMLVPALVDAALGNWTANVFVTSSAVTTSLGVGLYLVSRGRGAGLNAREAIVMTVGVWVVLPMVGALPLYWSGVTPTYTDAFFEAMSGVTTTGATVITGLDDLPMGILMWRAVLQWLGGLGIVVMAIAVLPMLQVGGMQLFRTEAFDTPEKILPRARQISGQMVLIYLALTLACAMLYALAGMTIADGVMHAMTTIATGGFSSRDTSVGFWNAAPWISWIAVVFMIAGSLPFFHYIQLVQGRASPFWRDAQVRVFIVVLGVLIVVIWGYAMARDVAPRAEALRLAAFNTTSIMTGTGYATANYDAWGPFAQAFFLIIMFIGGCAGSTACGIKIFRFQILYENMREQIGRLAFPHGVFVKRFAGRRLPDQVSSAVMSFFFLYFLSFGALSVALSFTGLDFLTAVSGAATAVSNVGPGLGDIVGPTGNFASLPDTAKWLLSFGMLLGRLELFTVLVLFIPAFWRV